MNGTSHKIAGASAALMVSTWMFRDVSVDATTYIAIGTSVIGGALGGLLPDIDHPGSTLGRRARILSYPINKLAGHRGITHTLLALVLLSYLLFVISGWIPIAWKGYGLVFFIGIIIGYASHLVLDMLTVSGIPLLYPFSSKMIRIAGLRTGKDDWLVILLTVAVTGTYLYYTL
ncbi:metal-dependent hydrolase [Caldibacillus debilis]|uniref:Putative membrane-bound metal-dependent hydrolase n=1 Tax=Caldibacillus debilis GB1 TaxID=1339248 RepID=A0A420VE04_9BACI|nr:metal-dependent hydrolase [Caldibacillus debilis]RKO61839.1 putative membrane-bound metal-dependent hydrolase [Caldibacillus debilis GB1]